MICFALLRRWRIFIYDGCIFHSAVKLYTVIGRSRFFLIFAILTGLLTGFASVLIRLLTQSLEYWRESFVFPLQILAPGIGILSACFLRRCMSRNSDSSSDMSVLIRSIRERCPEMITGRGARRKGGRFETFSHILIAPLCAGLGASSGLTTPGILSGASLGAAIGAFMHLDRKKKTRLMACGAAGGMAAIFSAPVSGVLFAIEVLRPKLNVVDLVPILLSSAASTMIAQLVFGREPVFQTVSHSWDLRLLLWSVPFGLFCAFLGVYALRVNRAISQKSRLLNPEVRLISGICIVVALTAFLPELSGEGLSHIAHLMHRQIDFPVILFLSAFLKVAVTSISLAGGGAGGLFSAVLFTGAFSGYGIVLCCGEESWITQFAVLGMCGVFSSAFKTPLTAIFLMLEMTGGYPLMIPLITVSAVSYFCSEMMDSNTIYTNEPEHGIENPVRSALADTEIFFKIDRNYKALQFGVPVQRDSLLKNFLYPVIDENGYLLGLLPGRNIPRSKSFFPENHAELPPCVLEEHDTFELAESAMEIFPVQMLPVLDESQRFCGFISRENVKAVRKNMETLHP